MSNEQSNSNSSRLLVVIVNYKTAVLTRSCLSSLEPEIRGIPDSHVVVVENASGEETQLDEMIRSRGWQDWVSIQTSQRNGGFGAGNNIALHQAISSKKSPQYFLLLNSDTEVRPGALAALLNFMDANPKAGIAGAALENPDGTGWPFAFRFITPTNQFLTGAKLGILDRLFQESAVVRRMAQDRPQQIDWAPGCSMIVRREVFNSIGFFDEAYFLYFEEVDLCLRAHRAGWSCWYVPESRVMHIGGQSSGLVGLGGKKHDELSPLRQRVPIYWFQSRRHYFLKNFGWIGSLIADLAFTAGYGSWRLRRFLQRKSDSDPPRMLIDLWGHSLSSLRHGLWLRH